VGERKRAVSYVAGEKGGGGGGCGNLIEKERLHQWEEVQKKRCGLWAAVPSGKGPCQRCGRGGGGEGVRKKIVCRASGRVEKYECLEHGCVGWVIAKDLLLRK